MDSRGMARSSAPPRILRRDAVHSRSLAVRCIRARSRPTCSSCNANAGSQLSRRTYTSVIASSVKCNASLRSLVLPHSIISCANFPCRRLLITFLTTTQPRISSRKFDRDGVKILRRIGTPCSDIAASISRCSIK